MKLKEWHIKNWEYHTKIKSNSFGPTLFLKLKFRGNGTQKDEIFQDLMMKFRIKT
jgi:hypothetical protein